MVLKSVVRSSRPKGLIDSKSWRKIVKENTILLPKASSGLVEYTKGNNQVISVDFSVLPFFLESLICSGASKVAVTYLPSHVIEKLPKPLQNRLILLGKDQAMSEFDVIMQPLSEEFKLEIKVSSVRSKISNNSNPEVSEAILHFVHYLYPFLIGIENNLQIDLNISEFILASNKLRQLCRSSESRTHIAMIEGLLSTYNENEIDSLYPRLTGDRPELMKLFYDFLHEKEYLMYSEQNFSLGFPKKLKRAKLKIKHLVKTLMEKEKFKILYDYSSKLVKVATKIPLPDSNAAQSLLKKQYLPPVISLGEIMLNAERNWAHLRPDPIAFDCEGVKNSRVWTHTSRLFEV